MKQPMSIYFWPLPRMTLRDRLAPIRGRHLMAEPVDTHPNEMSAEEFLRIVEATRPPSGRLWNRRAEHGTKEDLAGTIETVRSHLEDAV